MLCSPKAPFPRISGVGSLTLHNDHYPQINNTKGFEAYFLAVCEILTVYFIISLEKLDISAFLIFKNRQDIRNFTNSMCAIFVIFGHFKNVLETKN